jgi:lipoate-protein ligase A
VTDWRVERLAGSAAELHARELPDPVRRGVWILDASTAALVLGSTQREVTAAGIDVCRRRSGGGAVLVEPGEVLWVDVLVPRGDPLWEDDIGRAAHWLGDVWAEALGGGAVHTGGIVTTEWSSAICFAGIGPGEVLIDGKKVVGISQRRTRGGARFQSVVLKDWQPEKLARIFAPDRWREVAQQLTPIAAGVPDLASLETAFLAALSSR